MKKILISFLVIVTLFSPKFILAQAPEGTYGGSFSGSITPEAPAVNTTVMDPNQTSGQPVTSAGSLTIDSSAHVCGSTIIDITDVICKISIILNSIIPLLITLGVVYFIWGVISYVISDDEEAKKKGRDRIVFGIIGLAVIASVWGLVHIVQTTFNLSGNLDISAITSNIPVNNAGTCSLGPNPKLANLLTLVTCYISSFFVPLMFTLAILVFMWGVVQYIQGAEEQEKREKGRNFIIYGLVALAVMVSIWGLVHIFTNTFGIDFAIPAVQNTGQ